MSSKAIFIKDLKRTQQASYYELKKRKKKLLLATPIKRIFYKENFKNFKRNNSLSRVNRRCLYTGRKKGLIRYTKMTRMYFKEEVNKGFIIGLRKSSW